MFMLLLLNLYLLIFINSFIMSLFILGKSYLFILVLFIYFLFLWVLFIFYNFYRTFILTYVVLLFINLMYANFYILFLNFLSLFIYFIFTFLFVIKFFNRLLVGQNTFIFIILTLFFNFLLISLYCIIYLTSMVLFNIYIFDLFNMEESQTFFYLFKYEFKWLMIYAWGLPVFFCLVCQCTFLLFMLSSSGYDFSKNFEDNVSNWYCSIGYKELSCFHDVIYHPFKVMGDSFKFLGNYLDISENERLMVYVSSFLLILILVLFWIESMFFSMPINWLFLGFLGTECTHFNTLFKVMSKYFIILSIMVVIFINLFLVVSSFFIVGFICCFAGNLFVNYEVMSGKNYEPIYFTSIDGYCCCIITPSQFRVYHNVWFYNGIYWVLEETDLCKSLSGKSSYGYLVKL